MFRSISGWTVSEGGLEYEENKYRTQINEAHFQRVLSLQDVLQYIYILLLQSSIVRGFGCSRGLIHKIC